MSEEVYIRDYFNGKLSPGEHEQFEARYQEDSVFRAQADEMEVEILAIRAQSRIELKGRFASWTEEEQAMTSINMSSFWKMGLAASILVLTGISYWFWPTTPSGEDLFNSYYTHYENYEVTTSRSETNELAIPIIEGFKAYDEQAYQSAIGWFEQVNTQDKKYGAVMFFKGISYIEIDELENATLALQQVIDGQDADYLRPAMWYQALILIKQNRGKEAQQLLSKLKSSEGEYRQRALAILEVLD